jgi:hypothetical protein
MIDPSKPVHACGFVTPNCKEATSQVNNNGLAAQKWMTKLEALTLREDLQFLTFLPFRTVISKRETCRRQRAWCPSCLNEQFEESGTIYEHLLWTHKYVTVCPAHKLKLQIHCPHCGLPGYMLQGKMLPGHCGKCNGWLGEYSAASTVSLEEPNTNFEYEMFVAAEIGAIIAAAPNLLFNFGRETTKQAILDCIDQCFRGNVISFSKFLGLSKSDATNFGKEETVALRLLLRVAREAGTTLLNLLTNENVLSMLPALILNNAKQRNFQPRRRRQDIYTLLVAAKSEISPPSLTDVALRAGYTSTARLRNLS